MLKRIKQKTRKKSNSRARNQADALVDQTDKSLTDIGEKFDAKEKEAIEAAHY